MAAFGYQVASFANDHQEPPDVKFTRKANDMRPMPLLLPKAVGLFIPKVEPSKVPKPKDLKNLLMPCPIDSCVNEAIAWFCQTCQSIIKYLNVESGYYCECGMTEPQNVDLMCSKHENQDETQPNLALPLAKTFDLPSAKNEAQLKDTARVNKLGDEKGATPPLDQSPNAKYAPKMPPPTKQKPNKKGLFLSSRNPVKVRKPIKRRDVLIPCPRNECAREVLSWSCQTCQAVLEFGMDNGHFYCDCGETEAKNALFKCGDHGFKEANVAKLKFELDKMEPCEEMNILIMGETGVGKSTFINAFANYLTYSTVEEAFSSGKIITLIPNQFTLYDSQLNQVIITNGDKTSEEEFTPGQSATQGAKVYRFNFGDTILRLIDTPGIGDVRGTLKDNENFKNILDTIAPLDCLNGIIILLKPNQARLNVIFRYCIQELLTHLHKSAVENMIFGFTNSRGTNFQPGDTFPALIELLKHQAVRIKLAPENVYCFDSESYRFLSALRNGVKFDADLVDSYSKSWKHSVRETERLISYIRSLHPHVTKHTLSINNARILILQITKPMAEITRTIGQNLNHVKGLQEMVKELDEKNRELLENIKIIKTDLVPEKLGHPRTVCTNSDCIELIEFEGNWKINHVQWCHDHCYLKGVQVETLNNPQLAHCSAMDRSQNCKFCGHNYREHIHVTYELHEQPVEVEDKSKKNKHDQNMSFREKKANKIAQLEQIRIEYEEEYKLVEKIAAKFGAFLKHNAITPYSDARLDYLDHLVKDEKMKPADIRKNDLIRLLENAKATYKKEIEVIDKAIEGGRGEDIKDPAIVEKSINLLFDLKHFGSTLRQIKNTAVSAASSFTTYNETSHRYTSLSTQSPFKKVVSRGAKNILSIMYE